jgi:preprotein translocase subunit SecG
MFQFLLVVHVIVAVALVGVILMQRSEGGGFTGGGSPAGLMSARGAADFLTRTTTILATIFVLLSIGLAALATVNRAPAELDDSLARQPGAVPTMPAPAPGAVPLGGGATDLAPLPAAPATSAPVAVPPLAAPAPTATVQRERPQPRTETRRETPPVERPAIRPTVPEKAATPAAAPAAPAAAAPAPSGGNGTQ